MRVFRRSLLRPTALCLLAGLGLASAASAGPREQAKRIHDRLVGTPPAPAMLASMEALVASDDALGAAMLAMQNPVFYSSALKDFFTPFTNVEQTVIADLNDYSATAIGFVRDDRPWTEILSADTVYVGAPGTVNAPYSHNDNEHYRQLESQRVDLSNPSLFVPVAQSSLPNALLGPDDAAGVISTRAAGEAFFSAGTNRRMWRFVSMNFLCRDLEDFKDNTRATDRVRQDVSRSPGGDSTLYLNHCAGCHAGMDPIAGAFAYFEWNAEQGRVVYSRGAVQPKHLINANTFAPGYITVDDHWENRWREGPNAVLGWDANLTGSGFGAKSLGEEVAGSRAFSVCQVERVFEHVCFREPDSTDDFAAVERIADVFEAENHSLKRVFAETAVYCMGQ